MSYPSLSNGRFSSRTRILLCVFAVFVLFLIAVLFRLQIFDYGIYQQKVLEQITIGSSLAAERGNIYDANGQLLACNKTVWRIYLSPVDIARAEKRKGKAYSEMIAKGLSDILPIDYETVYQKAKKRGFLDQTIYKNADAETAKAVLQFAKQNGLSDMVHAEAGTARYYPFHTLASHTIGFTGSDNQGLMGLEAYYNSHLSGTDGQYLTAVDSQGIKLPSAYTDYIEAENGLSLVTTLDLFMQRELEHCLEQAMINADAQNRVTGIVMNVKTGAILAIATAPSFDLNEPYQLDAASLSKLSSSGYREDSQEYKKLRSDLLYTMWSNKAVSEIYEPGSTFKIVTVSVALETKAVSPSRLFSCPGYYMVGGCRISCHKHGGHGTLNLAEGLQQSCNPVMMQTAEAIGKESFYTYFQCFGYKEKTGIDLPGEGSGIFHSFDSLGSTELATTSFGQRFKVSILQQLCAVAAVANDGILVTPHLLKEIRNTDGETLFTYQTNEKRRVISSETAKQVATILEGGVSGNGGAKNAYVEGYGVAAKTGTSEKFEILDANGNSFLRIGSCVAFAPFDDAEIAMILVVDEPTSYNKYGSATAAPFVSDYLSVVLPYLGIEAKKKDTVTVENYIGMDALKAKGMALKSGFAVEVYGKGERIIAQSPEKGTQLYPEQGRVILYTDTDKKEVTVPKLTGLSLAEALSSIARAGLNAAVIGASTQNEVAAEAVVTEQSLPKGTLVESGTVITIRILHTNDSG